MYSVLQKKCKNSLSESEKQLFAENYGNLQVMLGLYFRYTLIFFQKSHDRYT